MRADCENKLALMCNFHSDKKNKGALLSRNKLCQQKLYIFVDLLLKIPIIPKNIIQKYKKNDKNINKIDGKIFAGFSFCLFLYSQQAIIISLLLKLEFLFQSMRIIFLLHIFKF